MQQWNFGIQRQIGTDWLVSASYIGNEIVHLYGSSELNPAIFFPGTANAGGQCVTQGYTLTTTANAACSTTANTDQRRRLFLQNPQEGQYYGNMATREDSGTLSYNGLLISIQRRAVRGVNIAGNYTWSHCIGDAATANATGRGGAGYLDPNNRAFDRGNCGSNGSGTGSGLDRRHVFNVTAVASTPQFANPTLRMLGTGWQLSTIYRQSSGTYLTISTGLDRVLSGQSANQRPNQVLENPFLDRNSLNYLNPRAFAQPAIGTIGNMRPANIVGPGTWQLDFGLSRIFKPRETQKLEFRAEAFNVTNSLRKGNPNTTLNSNTFGQITTSSDARIMQFALKYSF